VLRRRRDRKIDRNRASDVYEDTVKTGWTSREHRNDPRNKIQRVSYILNVTLIFFLQSGTPVYYNNKTIKLIQYPIL